MKIIDVNIDRQLKYAAEFIVGILIGASGLWVLWRAAVEVFCQ